MPTTIKVFLKPRAYGKKTFKKKNLVHPLNLLLLVGTMGACSNYSPFSQPSSNLPKEEDRIVEVTKGPMELTVGLYGNLEPKAKAIITSPFSGFVHDVHVKIGDKVKVDSPLISVKEIHSLKEHEIFPIRSPINGKVVQINHSKGERVIANGQQGEDFLLRVDDTSHFEVHSMASEIDRSKLKVGLKASVELLAPTSEQSKSKLQATLTSVSLASDSAFQYKTIFEIESDPTYLMGGQSAQVTVHIAKKEAALQVPIEAVQEHEGALRVKMKQGDYRIITPGLINSTHIEVISGLNDGDKIQKIDFSSLQRGAP